MKAQLRENFHWKFVRHWKVDCDMHAGIFIHQYHRAGCHSWCDWNVGDLQRASGELNCSVFVCAFQSATT